jgi:hypothetical protein
VVQLRILHLKFELVDLQFVDEPLIFMLISGGYGRLRAQPFLRAAAQFVGF